MKKTAAFEKAYQQLNARQKEAVDAIEGPVMVIAGPGTGKTQVLTLRMANILLKTDIEPEGILALTYTRNAAAAMQRRLAELIGAPAYRITITTFHGLCEQIIREHEERFTHLAGRRIAETADQRRILEDLFPKTSYLKLLASFGDDPYYVGPALRAIEQLKREGVSTERLDTLLASERTAITEDPDGISTRGPTKGSLKAAWRVKLERLDRLAELSQLYRDYEAALAKEGFYDYSDLLTHVRDALEKDELFRLSLQERYQYLLVDEHQDTNTAQNRIIELLASFFESPNLFLVGDEKQAIYRFQGASLDNFLYFKETFKDVRLIVLNENYRSTQQILDAAHAIRASQEPLQAQRRQGNEPIRLVAAENPDAQYHTAGQLIQKELDQGTPGEEIAVLYRRNTDGQAIARMLARMGIAYSLEARGDVLHDPDIKRLLALLDAVRDYGEPHRLYEALHVPWLEIAPLDVYKLSVACRRQMNPYDALAQPAVLQKAGIQEGDRMRSFGRLISHWHTLARQESPADTLEIIVNDSGCLAALIAHEEGSQKLARLHALYDMARSLTRNNRSATLMDFIDRLRYVREKGIRMEVPNPRMPGRVRLMTAHAAKGLEFDTVFLIDCYEKHWPSPRRTSPLELPASAFRLRTGDGTGEEKDAEERNLFFVALTRARKRATVLWPQRDYEGSELQPSRYLELLDPALVTHSVAKSGQEYSVQQQALHVKRPEPRTPELADREFLQQRFLEQGLSATALNNYLTCPWQYFYRNLVQIPEALTVHLMYGNAVDRALELFFQERTANTGGTLERLVALFDRTVQQQPFSEAAHTTAVERGRTALRGWYETWQKTWLPRRDAQVRITNIPLPDGSGSTLNGKIDALEHMDSSGAVRVIDYKTGRPKSRKHIVGDTKSGDGNYLRQLTFYRILLDRWKDGAYQMREGVLDFIDPDARGTYHKETFVIERSDTDALMEQIVGIANEIRELAFWDRTCGQKECRYCQLRTLLV